MPIQRRLRKVSELLSSFLLVNVLAAAAQTHPLKTIDMPQGGKIVYGTMDGADTQKSAILGVLRIMHKNCGEKPQIGQVFKLRGTDSMGLFFTVVNHSAGNVKVAGLILAAASGPKTTEAALMSDSADRFGSTINPMMTKLFSVWHPGGLPTPSAASSNAESAPPKGPTTASPPAPTSGHSAPAAKLHTVATSDNSVSIGIPDGWTLDPNSGHGTVVVKGPQGEVIALGMNRSGVDPTSQWQRNFQRMGGKPLPGQMVYPYRGNLIKALPDLIQAWRRAGGLGPAKLQIDKIEPTSVPPGSPQGEECVLVRGHLDPDGKGMNAWAEMMCATLPVDWGGYMVIRHQSLAPDSLFGQEEATRVAIVSSRKLNEQVLNQQMAEMKRQKDASDNAIREGARQRIGEINAIGAQATARMKTQQELHDAQHAQYWAQQDSNARNNQGFSNYLRDQTVVRDVQYPDEHVTVWNQTAGWLERAFPNRVEEVPPSQYIKGQDYF